MRPIAARAMIAIERTRVSHHEYTGNTRHSPRNGFNGFLRALPGDRACLPPSFAKIAFRKLDASVGASGPHDFTVRFSIVRPHTFMYRHRRVHRIPHPTFVTIAKRPSDEAGTSIALLLFLPNREAEYFSKWG